jgi:CRISPR-associated protein Csd2
VTTLQNKIDFAFVLGVKNANPNGDPLNGNRPRVNYDGIGEISDVCLKRKMRDRLLDIGFPIYVQSNDRKNDAYPSLGERAKGVLGENYGKSDMAEHACKAWLDVRAFGQLFALKADKPPKPKKATGKNKKADADQADSVQFEEAETADPDVAKNGDTGISIGIRGPVTVQSAYSVAPVDISSIQITKSVNGEGDGKTRGSDTMGLKHRVDNGVYVAFGSINPVLAERTGFTDADAEAIKAILPKLLQNDCSAARPEGSMEILKVIWWKHDSKAGSRSSSKVHRSLTVGPDGAVKVDPLDGVTAEIIEGF